MTIKEEHRFSVEESCYFFKHGMVCDFEGLQPCRYLKEHKVSGERFHIVELDHPCDDEDMTDQITTCNIISEEQSESFMEFCDILNGVPMSLSERRDLCTLYLDALANNRY